MPKFDPARLTEEFRAAWQRRLEKHGDEEGVRQYDFILSEVARRQGYGETADQIREWIIGSFWDSATGMKAGPEKRHQSIGIVKAMVEQALEDTKAE